MTHAPSGLKGLIGKVVDIIYVTFHILVFRVQLYSVIRNIFVIHIMSSEDNIRNLENSQQDLSKSKRFPYDNWVNTSDEICTLISCAFRCFD